MTQEELNKVLEAHKHYLAQDCEGWENMRADLRSANLRIANLNGANLRIANLWRADLRCADLSGANLNGADLNGADLSDADLSSANLRNANLWSADLYGADLYGADLRSANLSSADLRDADLSGADLYGANLRCADLRGAYLYGANLRSADLSGADLSGAHLSRAHLSGANLYGANCNECTAFFALVCPEEGDFIAWKRVDKVIIKLRIPAEAKRSSATSRKCRCEYAEVLALQNLDGTPYNDDKVVNDNYKETIYKVGEIVHPDSWDDDRWNECSHGIHFFITRDEAVMYKP